MVLVSMLTKRNRGCCYLGKDVSCAKVYFTMIVVIVKYSRENQLPNFDAVKIS